MSHAISLQLIDHMWQQRSRLNSNGSHYSVSQTCL